jgi:hypothetical protein
VGKWECAAKPCRQGLRGRCVISKTGRCGCGVCGEPADGAVEAVRISNGVHRGGRGIRRAAQVDGWKLGRRVRLERRYSGSDFHECGVRDRVCSESTEKGRLWRKSARGGEFPRQQARESVGENLAAVADGEDGESGEDNGQGGKQNFGDSERRVSVVG